MRVTDKMGYNQVIGNLQKNRGEMTELQNQASIQKRITKPSDDPVGVTRVLTYRTDEHGSEQFIRNINVARSFLEFTDVSLTELSESLIRLKELAIQQANDAASNPQTRRAVAEEVGQNYKQIVQIANRKLGERYIFGGFSTTSTPFDIDGNYSGDDGELKLHINKDAFVSMNIAGDRVFHGRGVGNDGVITPKDTAPKTVEELEKYQLDEKLRVQKNQEHEMHSIGVRGPANDNQRDEQAFKSDIHGDGDGINILESVKNFEIALRTNDKAEVQETIDNIDKALTQVIQARALVGARVQTLNFTQNSLQQNIIDSKGAISQIEDADLFQVASDITKTDSALRASLETSGKIVQPSLLDFLK